VPQLQSLRYVVSYLRVEVNHCYCPLALTSRGFSRTASLCSVYSEVQTPERFGPSSQLYIWLPKTPSITGRNVSPDVRNYFAHQISSMSVRRTMQHLYPQLLALHDLTDDIALADPATGAISFPSSMRDSHIFMTSNGVYLIGTNSWPAVMLRPPVIGRCR
jgi:protein transport protein SEC24